MGGEAGSGLLLTLAARSGRGQHRQAVAARRPSPRGGAPPPLSPAVAWRPDPASPRRRSFSSPRTRSAAVTAPSAAAARRGYRARPLGLDLGFFIFLVFLSDYHGGHETASENVTFTVTFSVEVVVKTASINRFCLPWLKKL